MAESHGPESTSDYGSLGSPGAGMGVARALAMHLTSDWC